MALHPENVDNLQYWTFFSIFLYVLTINCVTKGARELNGINQMSLAPRHICNSTRKMREI